MVSRLRPIDVEVSFEERTYHLGDNIDLTIELTPRRDCQVREARVDLVVDESWSEHQTHTVEQLISGTGSTGPRRVVTHHEGFIDHDETSVHSTIMFLRDRSLISGRTTSFQPRLRIEGKAPRLAKPSPQQTKVKMTWWLQTKIDVQGARDVKPRTKIEISVAPAL